MLQISKIKQVILFPCNLTADEVFLATYLEIRVTMEPKLSLQSHVKHKEVLLRQRENSVLVCHWGCVRSI